MLWQCSGCSHWLVGCASLLGTMELFRWGNNPSFQNSCSAQIWLPAQKFVQAWQSGETGDHISVAVLDFLEFLLFTPLSAVAPLTALCTSTALSRPGKAAWGNQARGCHHTALCAVAFLLQAWSSNLPLSETSFQAFPVWWFGILTLHRICVELLLLQQYAVKKKKGSNSTLSPCLSCFLEG